MKKIYNYLPFLILFLFQSSQAQISFTNRNDLLSNTDFNSGVAIAVTDMNNDGKDDIIRMDKGYDLSIEYQNDSEEMFTSFNVGDIDFVSQWSMCVADVDNNGYNEVFTGGSYDNVKLAVANDDGTEYTTTFLPGPSMFVQGSNFVDINNDGLLDIFACHDDAASRIWGNDGNGVLSMKEDWIDLSINGETGEGASGNYGSVWTDFDNDGDIDLYIAKCRQGVGDPTDHRRINKLYVNDGAGNYAEMGGQYGLNIGWQSWTADFQDVNNDGWLDCFVTNHDHESQLLINDGTGHYVEATDTGIEVDGLAIQGIMRDFDNDGWVDILVSGTKHHLFLNNGDTTFTEVMGLFDFNDIQSYALGDLNSDGFVDIYAGYALIFTNPSSVDDVLWINDGNDNNYLAVQLEGIVSNRSAVGARVEIYGDWGIQIREVRAGESYGIMNSTTQYFGLGQATAVDSVTVRWPSGVVQTQYNVNPNSTLQLIEGGCLATVPDLDVVGSTTFCTGDTIMVSAPSGYNSYAWSTGDSTQTIAITTQGNFSLTVTDGDGCFGFSSSVATVVDPVLTPEIEALGDLSFCEGEQVEITEVGAPDAISYLWSNGETGSSITATESGTYSVTAVGLCADYISNTIEVDVIPYPVTPTGVGDTVMMGEPANLVAAGNNLAWFDVASGGIPLGFGNDFITPTVSATTTFYVEDRNGEAGLKEKVGMVNHSGSDYSNNLNSNNRLIFDALQAFTLDSVKVYTDMAGDRVILLMDAAGNQLDSAVVNIPVGESVVHLGLSIPEGNDMFLTTDPQVNFDNLGIGGPRLRRSDENISYPYVIPDYVSINSSNFGSSWYYYFYDWRISTPDNFCVSERVPVEVLLDTDVATIDFGKTGNVKVYPNPSAGNVALQINFDV
ncbi:MAG: FG-GAP-like repeat-containing protein, partial [Bacteroidota bacterium]